MATREDLDRAAQEMSWEDQNWFFRKLMERLWPDLKGKRVVPDAASSWTYDDGYTEEDDEWFRKKAEEVERERRAGSQARRRGNRQGHGVPRQARS